MFGHGDAGVLSMVTDLKTDGATEMADTNDREQNCLRRDVFLREETSDRLAAEFHIAYSVRSKRPK